MTLGARLRELRNTALRRPVRQAELGRAINIGNSSISNWESDAKTPGNDRLREIATFYATARSLDPPRVLPDSELDADERARRDELFAELTALRDGPESTTANPWHFPDGAAVRILCGAIPDEDRPRFASGRDHNYMGLSAYADQDALIELFGHVRAQNPQADVQYTLTNRLESDDLQGHLVYLGNLGLIQDGAVDLPRYVPIRQVGVEGLDGEVFETRNGTRYGPTLTDDNDPSSAVVEDVGFFWRGPSPTNGKRTLTVCSGVFTRGVYGAVRLLTDRSVRDGNSRYLRERFRGASSYGLLVRVPVHDHATSTPDLGDEKSRILELGPDS